MANLRLVLLRWKMESRAWLEAVWDGRWFGIALTSICVAVCIYLQWNIPGPGVSVAVMGVAAALMTARAKASGAEKAVWMLIITSLLLSEVLAIRKDRREHDDQLARILSEEVQARGESKIKFGEIGEGINNQSRLSVKQFEDTVTRQSRQFSATMAIEKKNIDQITGGDSFAIVIPNTTDSKANSLPLAVTMCLTCEESINASVYIVPNPLPNSGVGNQIFQGQINPHSMFSLGNVDVSRDKENVFKITVFARNKPTFELLKVRFNVEKQHWEFSIGVIREEKGGHFNPKTNMAEGQEFKVLMKDTDWGQFDTTPSNPATITIH